MANARVFGIVGGLLSAAALAGCVTVDSDSRSGDTPRVYAGMGETLSAPSSAPPEQVVSSFLAGKNAGPLADELRVAQRGHSTRSGLTHLKLQQQVGSLRVEGGYVKATLRPSGELVHLIEKLAPVPDRALSEARLTPAEALGAALDHLGYEVVTPAELAREGETVAFDKGEVFHREPTVERVALSVDGELEQGFAVETWSEEGNLLHHTLLDGDGDVVSVELRTNTDSYNVFVEDPSKGAQAVVTGPAPGTSTESPAGWLGSGAQTTINVAGNNVNAYLDVDRNNRADRGGTSVSNGQFLTAANLTAAPTTTGNRAVAVQNLFYLNNVVHDALYTHGFTEAAGNFQSDNFGLGGASGADPVLAEAQDGSGVDNANFATPADGSRPRMQMYLWTGVGPDALVVVGAESFGGSASTFGPALTTTGKLGLLALGNDGVAPTGDGCTSMAAGSLTGKVALLERGTCNFTVKVLNAQSAGAAAVVVVNNEPGDGYFAMGGTEKRIKISSLMVGHDSGATLLGLLGQSATVRSTGTKPLQVDASLDADIVAHEYGHGLTWRMIGGMSGPLAGAIGEGASDTVAMLLNGDDVVAEYSASDEGGIRRAPYAGYPYTYGDVTGAVVHDDGEVYAAAMWRLIELFAGRTADLFGYFVDGMNYTPSSPAYEDMRDGMLQAAASAPADQCLIWQGFAELGVGVSASGTTSQGGVTIVESFELPATCP